MSQLRPTPKATRALLSVSAGVFLCTSIWFSGTAAAPTLSRLWDLSGWQAAWLTISVQLGFISGTFLYALLNLPDVFNPRRVFFFSALIGALFNAAFAFSSGLTSALLWRFLSGVTLAGIYPVGMKIVASWFRRGLGWRLGVLIAALTGGKAFSYLVQTLSPWLEWQFLTAMVSLSSLIGGTLVLGGISDGPYLSRRAPFHWPVLFQVFRNRRFRYTALGYFGHMWELYAFWSLIGYYLAHRLGPSGTPSQVSFLTFLTVGVGVLGCLAGGWASRRIGERRVALAALAASGLLCAFSGLLFWLPFWMLLPLVLFWGIVVIADSAQFSALAARYCPPEYTGTALTVQNGVGFAITVASIQLLPLLAQSVGWQWAFTVLALGPAGGSWALVKLRVASDE